MEKVRFFQAENNKVFTAIFEDYFIVIQLFSFETSITETTGSYSTSLRLDRLILDEFEISKEVFQQAYERAITKLSKLDI